MSKDIVNDIVIPGRNGGRLTPGNPGNKGGKGAIKSEVRQRCVDDFDTNRKVAIEILQNEASLPADRLRALDLLGKYGGLQQVDNTSGDKPITEVIKFGAMTLEEKRQWLANLPK